MEQGERRLSHTELRAELGDLLTYCSYSSTEIREGCAGGDAEVVLGVMKANAEQSGDTVADVAKSYIVAELNNLQTHLVTGEHYDSQVEGLVTLVKLLVAQHLLLPTDLGEQLLREDSICHLPLLVVWRLATTTRVLSVEQIIHCASERNVSDTSIADQLFREAVDNKGDGTAAALSDVLAVFVNISYTNTKEQYGTLRKFTCGVLSCLTARILDHILDSSSEAAVDGQVGVVNIYALMLDNLKVIQEALEGYCEAQLVQVLTHRPILSLGAVVKRQDKWRSTQANVALSQLLEKLVVGVGHQQALAVLDNVVTNDEVNWSCVLTLVATALNAHTAAIHILKGMIEQNIRQGCVEMERDSVIIGLLFARHASQEGPHIFPSYAHWFQALFGSEASSPAPNKQSFVFLIRFLTELIPHEPAHCLRAHLNARIFIPSGCQELVQNYGYIARARLQELKDSMVVGGHQLASPSPKVVEEVEAAVHSFNNTGKIPSFVLEVSIFREAYYRTVFLPLLLTPRPAEERQDARSQLVEALHLQGKISSVVFEDYKQACQRETASQLGGTSSLGEEAREQNTKELREVLRLLEEAETEAEVLRQLSQATHTLETMVAEHDRDLRNLGHLTLHQGSFNPHHLPAQAVEVLLGCVQRSCVEQQPGEDQQVVRKAAAPAWVTQLVVVAVSSVSVQQALFSALLHSLTLAHHQPLPTTQVEREGLVLSELSKLEGVVLPVMHQPHLTPVSFIHLYLSRLRDTVKHSPTIACGITSSWIRWQLGCEAASLSPLSPALLHLYLNVAPRHALHTLHQDEGVSVGDVYAVLEGCEVPPCCSLYFTPPFCSTKVPLEEWLRFELEACWGAASFAVRLTFLKCRLLRHVELGSGEDPDPATVLTRVIFVLLKLSWKWPQSNVSDIVVLLQSLAAFQTSPATCLLEVWHQLLSQGHLTPHHHLSFMSLCRCVSPALFLVPGRLLELSAILHNFVKHLMRSSCDVQLAVCDAEFLVLAVLNAAASPSTLTHSLNLCLAAITPAIVYHWNCLQSIFKNFSSTITNHSCLEKLWQTLTNFNKQSANCLTKEEFGLRLLSLQLSSVPSARGAVKELASVADAAVYLRCLLSYVGMQQVKGHLPLLPGTHTSHRSTLDRDKQVLTASKAQIRTCLAQLEVGTLTKEIFPKLEEENVVLKMIPVACAYILLSDDMLNLLSVELFHLLLHCQNVLCETFDSHGKLDQNVILPIKKKTWERNNSDLEYLAKLNEVIFSCMKKLPMKSLGNLPESFLQKCSSELRTAIRLRLEQEQHR